jgi:PAS domain S-box-containing protein
MRHRPPPSQPPAAASDVELARTVEDYRRERRTRLVDLGASPEILRLEEEAARAIDGAVARYVASQNALLRDTNDRLHLAVDASDLGIWDYDPSTGERRWSARCKQIFGFPADDSIVSQEAFLVALHPDDRPRWYAASDAALQPDGSGLYRVDYRIRRIDDGEERWIAATGRTIFVDKKPVRMLGTLADITDRIRAEQERELFLGMLGHDLRNPLGAVMVGARMLAGNADPSVARIAGMIAQSGTRMSRMIADLLDLARARARRIRIHRTHVELGALCRSVIAEFALTHPDRALRCDGREPVFGAWDKDRLEQVVQNLVANALIHGRTDTPVTVSVGRADGRATIDVENQGPPIPPEVQAHIFDPFHRGSGEGDGLGLGLYIAKHVVATHGGTLSFMSDASSTCFRVTLPRDESP